jgi:N utilization substance protein B
MKRRKTRELVIKALFAYEVAQGSPFFHLDYISQDAEMAGFEDGTLLEFLATIEDDFGRQLTAGIIENCMKLDETIDQYAVDWDIKRMGGADRNILRMGVYEMLYGEKLHPAIAINEAVELAKVFGNEESARFINGILGKLAEALAVPVVKKSND